MRDRSSGSSSSFPPHHCNPLLSLKNETSQELRRSPIELFWTAKKQTFTCVCAFVEILQISHNIQDNFPSAVVKKTFNPVVFINFKIALFASTRFGCLGVAPCVYHLDLVISLSIPIPLIALFVRFNVCLLPVCVDSDTSSFTLVHPNNGGPCPQFVRRPMFVALPVWVLPLCLSPK